MNPRSWLRSLLFDNTTPRPERRGQRSRSRSRRANAISPRLETLEDRLAPATISISDASAAEGASALKFIDRFVADGSGGLSSSRLSTFGPDGNGDGVQDFYVTSGLTDQILRYDGRNGAFLDVFVGSGSGGLDDPHGVAFGPSDGMLYVSSYGSHDVLRYNGATGAFVDRVASGLSQPLGLTFGNDGNLYIADHGAHKILRYNSSSGLLSDFVSARSGGLDSPYRPAFGPDGNLYLGSAGTKQVLRYDGQTGAFLDVFASTSVASQGRGPAPIAFGPDGYLYTTARPTPTCCDTSIIRFDASNGAFVDSYTLGRDGWAFILGPDGLVYDSANSSGGFVDRFGSSSLAAFTVKLDSPSATPVTVNYATASGTALAGSDFTAVSGTVTFAPGQTSQTILVNTIDNSALEPVETFVVNLSNPSGATIADGQAVGTILDNDGVPNPSGPTISIGNVAATEGSSAMNFIDDFVSADSGGVSQPRGALIGPDGNLYVASFVSDQILKYDARNGAFLGVFVATGSGGLDGPWAMVFGPDGNGDQVNDLYVGSEFSHSILRYNGVTGEFIDAFVPSGGYGRLVKPKGLTFGPDGHLYVSSGQTTPTFWPWEVLRFDGQTGAFLDIFVTNGSGGLANPNDLRFGPDGSLYVTSNHTDQILRYNGVTGAFVDAFVPAGSGGLDNPTFLEFRPDGLYVAGQFSNSVTRYNPATGAYIDTPVPTGSGGLSNPFCFVFDSTGALLVGSTNTNQILRYSPASQAAFKVTLSAPSATEITVDYSTSNGTAVAGSDYQQSLYTLKFAPGVTTRTILVPTLDDTIAEPTETFTVNLSNVSGGTIADGQGVGSILDNEIATQFYVVNDGLSDQTYRYSAGGASLATTNLGSSNTAPRGAASNVAGDRIWVADANKAVYVYNPAGTLLGSWTAGSLASNAEVEGFATNGTDVWIVDSRQDKVFKYTGAASRLSGSQNAASSFNLAGGNNNPKGIVTDGTSIWVVNDGGTDKVYKYTMTGALLGSWTITGAGSTPTGITLDPTGPGHLWVVDGGTDRVYEYSGALTRISGSQSPSSNFVLAAGNSNPQDIADPVGAGVSLAPTATTLTSGSANPAAPAQALTFTATVTGGADGEVVELHDNTNDGAVIATAQLSGGSAAFSVPAHALALGKHELAAVYPGTGA
jgi:sugar lactone lactonase YvrE